jgi:LPXTG-motif cell wall-anchored protein
VTQKHVEVPTVVESGLATLDKAEPAAQTSDPTGLFVLIGVALLGLGYVALRRSKQ